MENALRDLKPSASVQILSADGVHCQCVKYNCGCCARFTWKDLKLVNAIGQCYTSHAVDSLTLFCSLLFFWKIFIVAKIVETIATSTSFLFSSAFIAVSFRRQPHVRQQNVESHHSESLVSGYDCTVCVIWVILCLAADKSYHTSLFVWRIWPAWLSCNRDPLQCHKLRQYAHLLQIYSHVCGSYAIQGHSRIEVIYVGSNRKPVCDFLLVDTTCTNLPYILSCPFF